MPELRPARDEDVAAMMDVFWTALDDLVQRHGRQPEPRNPAALGQLIRHLAATDPASSLVADEGGRVVAFGMLHVRGRMGFLAFLFVLPEWQGRGLGRAILAACREAAGEPEGLATCAEADQPVSTGMYASIGMAPRMPLYLLRGRLAPDRLPELPAGLRARPLEPSDVQALDGELLGYQRPDDHASLLRAGRRGWAIEDGRRVIGYGYAQASGRLGPMAVADPELVPGLIGHLTRSVTVVDGWQVVVPGVSMALPLLLRQDLRIDGTPAVFCANHEGPRFDRYTPISYALI